MKKLIILFFVLVVCNLSALPINHPANPISGMFSGGISGSGILDDIYFIEEDNRINDLKISKNELPYFDEDNTLVLLFFKSLDNVFLAKLKDPTNKTIEALKDEDTYNLNVKKNGKTKRFELKVQELVGTFYYTLDDKNISYEIYKIKVKRKER